MSYKSNTTYQKSNNLITKYGGYRNLLSFQMSTVVYDYTVKIVETHIDKRSRTQDQMVQASRSGKQNIAEASSASGTSNYLLDQQIRRLEKDFLEEGGFTERLYKA